MNILIPLLLFSLLFVSSYSQSKEQIGEVPHFEAIRLIMNSRKAEISKLDE